MATTEPTTVAHVLNEDGSVYDRTYNWESGRTYANEGYVVKAVADDGSMTAERAQSIYDSTLADYQDCFGAN